MVDFAPLRSQVVGQKSSSVYLLMISARFCMMMEMSEYEHEVFVSYGRGPFWTDWVRGNFVEKLSQLLASETGNEAPIFVDSKLKAGADWRSTLRKKIARSRVMVAIIEGKYFSSEVCRWEMALMLEREQNHDLRGSGDNYGLVIPIRIGDGKTFPSLVRNINYLDFEEYANPDIPSRSATAQEFFVKLRALAKHIVTIQGHVPVWDAHYETYTGAAFLTELLPPQRTSDLNPRLVS